MHVDASSHLVLPRSQRQANKNTTADGTMALQVRILVPGCQTVLGDAAADSELFMTDEVEEVLLSSVQGLATAKQLQREFDPDLRTRHFKEDEELRKRNAAAKAAGKHGK